ncbi:hypothetical protein FLAV_01941 [Flavobacteriales bacterium]|nr:hypothetical protein FLAV_01941 [Flavobacteriales bacterium]
MAKILANIGKCIYCSTMEGPLTKEHIIPNGLSGPWVLEKATCKRCADITSKFEKDVLRGLFIIPRTALRLKTYNPKERPEGFPLKIIKGGIQKKVIIPIQEYPAKLSLFITDPPACISNIPYEKGIIVTGMCRVHISGPSVEEFRKKHGAKKVVEEIVYSTNFARMLAKIAYGMSIAQIGIDNFEEVYVLPSILGHKDDVGRWVGTAEDIILGNGKSTGESFHIIRLTIDKNYEVQTRIKLFATYNVPEYIVVVGRVKSMDFNILKNLMNR